MSEKEKLVEEIVLALIRAGVLKLEEIDARDKSVTAIAELVARRVQCVKNLVEKVAPKIL